MSRSQSVCSHQEDEVRPLVVERDRRTAERSVVGALRGWMPERLTCQLGVVQLLFKVCSHANTHTRGETLTSAYPNACMHIDTAEIASASHSTDRDLRPRSLKADHKFVWNPRACCTSPRYATVCLPPRQLRPLSLRLL